ncbi:VOC family protein [Kribbella sp. CA-293567]|uniref:VOC family protein n=1 Tax=Kribbella sp. CA-293567 TaxID=3002436 RepID=UPI0022DCEF02|nr:VOC family protein [Kribbella sp. CA-293567]WBQ04146.1 hypothetical protein OX958_29785 [Kribbella sp. CA-293567]
MIAWYDAPSLTASAALAARIAELTDGKSLPELDLRPTGVRVRIDEADLAAAVEAAAGELGMTADPAAPQVVRLSFDAVDTPAVRSFWQGALGYEAAGDGLVDPLRREPAISFHPQEPPRLLRNRIHVDIVRVAEAVEAFRTSFGQHPYGAYGLTLKDAEGNEMDLVPGGTWPEQPATDDWRLLFSAMTFYPTTSSQQTVELAGTVAALADAAGRPLLIDLRPDGVTIDTGKDQWENDETAFAALAAEIQTAARELGLIADPARLRFVQFAFDAVDIPAVRAFWLSVLGYQRDPRDFLTDIYDPRRLTPVIMFQQLDPEDPRRQQRDRVHLDLFVPADQVRARLATGVEAGGTLLADGHTLADPEGNEVGILTLDG